MAVERKKEKLNRYLLLKFENEMQHKMLERLHKLKHARPEWKASEEARLQAIVETNLDEMYAIQRAVESVEDPMLRMVLRLRYLDAVDVTERKKWDEIALTIYGSSASRCLKSLFRLHDQALKQIEL